MYQVLIESPNPMQPVTKNQRRKRGRLDDSLAAPRAANSALPKEVSGEVKRRQGGQPGNTNALKHGRYLAGYRLRNSAKFEAHIPDIYDLIDKFKRSTQFTYEVSMNADHLEEYTETLRSLSMAVNEMIRLINLSTKIGKSTVAPDLEEF